MNHPTTEGWGCQSGEINVGAHRFKFLFPADPSDWTITRATVWGREGDAKEVRMKREEKRSESDLCLWLIPPPNSHSHSAASVFHGAPLYRLLDITSASPPLCAASPPLPRLSLQLLVSGAVKESIHNERPNVSYGQAATGARFNATVRASAPVYILWLFFFSRVWCIFSHITCVCFLFA